MRTTKRTLKEFAKRLLGVKDQPIYVPPVEMMTDECWYEEYWLYFMETTDTLGDIDEQWASHVSMIGR